MNSQYIKDLISKGEGVDIEFKESQDSLSRSVFETICAFLNRKGGHILLGVKDDRSIIGVREDSISFQLDTLAKDMNNPQLISPTFFFQQKLWRLMRKRLYTSMCQKVRNIIVIRVLFMIAMKMETSN